MRYLSPKQHQVLKALVAGATVSAAAEAAEIHRTTVHHWSRTIPMFGIVLKACRASQADAVAEELRALVEPALAVLRQALLDESVPLSLKVKVALAILKQSSVDTSESFAVDAAQPFDPGVEPGLEEPEPAESEPAEPAVSETGPAAAQSSPTIHQNSSQFITNSGNSAHISRKTPRNAPCPCRSGLKFKKCCGRTSPELQNVAA